MPVRPESPRKSNSSAMKIVPIVVILIGAAIAAYVFFFSSSSTAPTPVATKAAPAAPGSTAAPAATAPAAPAAPVPEMSKEQLLKEASTAFREQRYVAPPGNNALEYYLRVLDKEPNNGSAREALREGFPFFTGPVEQYINAGNIDEANRVIDLLTKVDPNNFTLNILRSKLDAKKKQVDHDQQVATAAATRAAAATAQNAQNGAAAPAATPDATQAAAATTAAAKPAAAPAAAPTPPPAPVQAPAPTPAPAGESHVAELVRAVQPDYPPDAYRSRSQGWVDVEFTVSADGTVSNAQVVGAQPTRIFNSAAINAVKRWTFKPKMENGKAVEEQMRRRIEFKLGA